MNPRISRALDSSWRFVGRVARYLGPLLRDTGAYLWRLSLDTIGGLRILFMHWRARRNPGRTAEYVEQQAVIRARRVARWAPWRGLTATRRMEVRAAATVFAVIVFVVAGESWLPSRPGAPSSNAPEAGESLRATDAPSPVTTPAIDVRQVVAGFDTARRRLGPGEWAVLREPLVLERGRLGQWDDLSIASPIVLKDEGRGRRYRMWYRGCRLAMREHSCGVGHATSRDGVVWEKAAEPVFVPGDPALRDNLEEIAVVKTGDRYYLWYSVMANAFSGRRRATLHLATSSDGLAWTDEGQVLEGTPGVTMIIQHSVFHDGQRFHLWYATKVADVSSYFLQHLSSQDGKAWRDMGGTWLTDLEGSLSFDAGRLLIQPREGGGFRALFAYEPHRRPPVLGSLVSQDGTTWTADSPTEDALRAWPTDDRGVQSLSAVSDAHGLWIWMELRSPRDEMQVGVAFRKAG